MLHRYFYHPHFYRCENRPRKVRQPAQGHATKQQRSQGVPPGHETPEPAQRPAPSLVTDGTWNGVPACDLLPSSRCLVQQLPPRSWVMPAHCTGPGPGSGAGGGVGVAPVRVTPRHYRRPTSSCLSARPGSAVLLAPRTELGAQLALITRSPRRITRLAPEAFLRASQIASR